MAINENLNQLEKNSPNKRVGIVAFSNSVHVIGDGRMEKIEIEGENLTNKEIIKSIAQKTPPFELIKNNKDKLLKKIDRLD